MNSYFRDNGPTELAMHRVVPGNPHSKNPANALKNEVGFFNIIPTGKTHPPMSNFHFLAAEWLQL